MKLEYLGTLGEPVTFEGFTLRKGDVFELENEETAMIAIDQGHYKKTSHKPTVADNLTELVGEPVIEKVPKKKPAK